MPIGYSRPQSFLRALLYSCARHRVGLMGEGLEFPDCYRGDRRRYRFAKKRWKTRAVWDEYANIGG